MKANLLDFKNVERSNEKPPSQAGSSLEGSQDYEAVIKLHRPGLREKVFFLVSGIVVSVPLTLFVSGFSDSLCVLMPILYANVCSIAIVAPLVEEFAKAYPLFYRHGETQRSIFTLAFLLSWRLYRKTSEKIVDWQSDRP